MHLAVRIMNKIRNSDVFNAANLVCVYFLSIFIVEIVNFNRC